MSAAPVYRPKGQLTLANARRIGREGRDAIDAGARVIDLSEVAEADSVAVALLLNWLRHCPELQIASLPETVGALARVYGVDALIRKAEVPSA